MCVYWQSQTKQSFCRAAEYEDGENNDNEHDDNTIIITIFNDEEFVIFFKTCVCMLAQREIAELILWPIGQKQTIQERQYY